MRDWDNVRYILLEVEQVTNSLKWGMEPPTPGAFAASVYRDLPNHVEKNDHSFMVLESKYVKIGKHGSLSGPDRILGLTYEGLNMVDAIRDDEIWAKIRSMADECDVCLTDDLVLEISKYIQAEKFIEFMRAK